MEIEIFSMPTRGNPYLTDAAIKTLEDACDESECPARLDGIFKHLSGLVYKEFSGVHRIPAFEIPKDWTRYMVQDFHQRKACAILWAAVDPRGTLYFYDELKIDKTIPEIAEVIKLKEKLEYKRPVPTRWIDSIAATPDRNTKTSPLKDFRNAGERLKWSLAFRASTKSHAAGFKAVHEYLRIKNNVPGVYFLEENVPHTIAAMMHYQWDDFEGTNEKTKESEHSHFADCIRYICVMKPTYKRMMPVEMGYEQEMSTGTTGYRGG